MVQNQCKCCRCTFDTGELALDQKVRPIFDKHTVMGYGICPECQSHVDDGYIALIGAVPSSPDVTHMNWKDAKRLDEPVIWMRKEPFKKIFSVDIIENNFIFVDQDVVDMVKKMADKQNEILNKTNTSE